MTSRGLRYPRSELAILRDLVRAQEMALETGGDFSFLRLMRRAHRLRAELEDRQSLEQDARMCRGPKAALE